MQWLHTHKKTLAVLCLSLMLLSGTLGDTRISGYHFSANAGAKPKLHLPLITRQAMRLQRRLFLGQYFTPRLAVLEDALRERKALLTHTLMIQFAGTDEPRPPLNATLSQFPAWLSFHSSAKAASFEVDPWRIEQFIRAGGFGDIAPPKDTTLYSFADDGGVLRGRTQGVAKSGYMFDARAWSQTIANAFATHLPTVALTAKKTPGRIVNTSGKDVGKLALLASGKSNFAHSPLGRATNIQKGLEMRLQNVMVADGASFSFNNVIGDMNASDGWMMSLGIFNGTELRPIIGAGICQAATTLYRALLHGGFPILSRANHSLFVTYYEKYGLGQDATVFPGEQDLAFINNTGNYLLLQSYIEGDDAFVNIYGTPDGRTVSLDGPFLTSNAPTGFTVNKHALHANEIAWVQHIQFPDGREEEHTILSRYVTGLPKRLFQEYVRSPVAEVAHLQGKM